MNNYNKRFISSSFWLLLLVGLVVMMISSCKGNDYSRLRRGNQLVTPILDMPASFNSLISRSMESHNVFSKVYLTLYKYDDVTYEPIPYLAKSMIVSDDKLTYTFFIDENARWNDGTPVTADDVLFTYDTIMNPDNLTGIFRVGYEREIEKLEKIDNLTVRFTVKSAEWKILASLVSFIVIPKKDFEGKDFNKSFNFELPNGNGPYILDRLEPGRFITMKKNPVYWRRTYSDEVNKNRFDKITYRVISNHDISYEALKKGDIDAFTVPTAEMWNKLTKSEIPNQVSKNWILLKKVKNYMPLSFSAFYFNLRRDKFKDINTRRAMKMLLDFNTINEKILYNEYRELKSFMPGFFDQQDGIDYYGFDSEKARKLLRTAGWTAVDSDGVLKNEKGERFEIDFTIGSASLLRHLTIYKEELQKVGIKLNINQLSYSAYIKKCFENHDFDMIAISWGGGYIYPSLDDQWGSQYASVPNTNNVGGYQNSEIDRLKIGRAHV